MRFPTAWILVAALAASTPVMGQEIVEGQQRSVRTGYAQVLRVQPVFQTVTTTRMEQRCDGKVVPLDGVPLEGQATVPATPAPDCELVPVERQFRRPIGYDVDYVYRGLKYRSRLPYDPGNRLRVQISIQPYIPPPGSD